MEKESIRRISWNLRACLLLVVAMFSVAARFSSIAGAEGLEPSPTVTFNENDNASDSVSTYQDASYGVTEGLTLFANLTPTFSYPGYTFDGWNTNADGSGTQFTNGEAYTFTANLVLWAQWTVVPVTNTVTFLENDSATDAVNSFQIGSSPEDLTLLANLTPAFSNPGHTFEGWNTAANGSGTSYSDGGQFAFAANMTLYAQWVADPPVSPPSSIVVISIDDNGGGGSTATLSGSAGSSVALPGPASVEDPGYILTSWNTAANGSGTSFAPGQSVTLSTAMTLYAQWQPATVVSTSSTSLSVSFIANGASGSLVTITGTKDSNVTLPSSSNVVREGYTLTSWNTELDGKGMSYKPGANVTLSSSLTLYAQWVSTGAKPSVLYGAIGDFSNGSTGLSATLERQVRDLANVLKTKKYKVVRLYGYTAETGLTTLDRSLSAGRASSVADYLRDELRALKVTGVSIATAGEGSVEGETSSLYSRVEVFVS